MVVLPEDQNSITSHCTIEVSIFLLLWGLFQEKYPENL